MRSVPPTASTREPDPGEQERDPDDDAEERELLCHVARVERRRERRRRHPGVAGSVRDGLAVVTLDCQRLVGRALGIAVRGEEASHLGVDIAARRLQRVDAQVLRECTRLAACVDRLAGHGDRGDVERRHRQACLRRRLRDQGRGHVLRADDLLGLEAVLHGAATVHAHRDCRDAERDQHSRRDESSDFQCLAHLRLPSLAAGWFVVGLVGASVGRSAPRDIGAKPPVVLGSSSRAIAGNPPTR